MLTIAHRLNTIVDYDRVMVLSDGLIKEFDNPQKLMADPSTQFYSMAADAGLITGETKPQISPVESAGNSSAGDENSQHDHPEQTSD